MELLYVLFFFLFGKEFSSNKVEGLQSENIVGGTLASSVALKYVVALIYRIDDKSFHCPCAAAIISDWHIATAAHCFYNKTSGRLINKLFEVVISTVNLDNPTYLTRYIQVRFVIIPKRYEPTTPETYSKYGDLAIVKLKDNFRLSSHKEILKELSIPQREHKTSFQVYTVSGFGWNNTERPPHKVEDYLESIQTGKTDRRLRYAHVRVLSKQDCENIFPGIVADGNMCAKIIRKNPDMPSGICQFDSGAPLMHNRYLDGIAVTGSSQCDEQEIPAIYIKMFDYRHFISYIMADVVNDHMLALELEEVAENQFQFKTVRSIV